MSDTTISFAGIFGDGMVLQRDKGARIWGRAAAGTDIVIHLAGQKASVRAGNDGRWMLELSGLPPGGPHDLLLNGLVRFRNVWIGDVWLCSGQSNMERSLEACATWPGDPAALKDSGAIRQITIPQVYDFSAPRDDIAQAAWFGADSDDIGRFSATAFHFARELYRLRHIPQGIILNAVGGSPAQAWLSAAALEAFPEYQAECRRCADKDYRDAVIAQDAKDMETWFGTLEALDPSLPSRKDFSLKPWMPIKMPQLWEDTPIGNHIGSIWFRKSITIPSRYAGKPGRLHLGCLVNSDQAFVNGIPAGITYYQYPTRRYAIPAGCLKEGENEVLIRIVAPEGHGGFVPGKRYKVEVDDLTVQLEGIWEYQTGSAMPYLPPQTFFQYKSGGLFNGILAPLAPYGLAGVLWYQGESNTGSPGDYQELMTALIQDWRTQWKNPSLPFLTVQLPAFMKASATREDSGWASIRDAQRRCTGIPHCAMAVILDQGEWNELHPADKSEVGRRLALLARSLVQGETVENPSGPLPTHWHISKGRWLIDFDHAAGGLLTNDGGAPGHCFLAGADGIFLPAQTRIQGSRLEVWSHEVPEPVSAAYAWASNPQGANLCNRQGLPASPFCLP